MGHQPSSLHEKQTNKQTNKTSMHTGRSRNMVARVALTALCSSIVRSSSSSISSSISTGFVALPSMAGIRWSLCGLAIGQARWGNRGLAPRRPALSMSGDLNANAGSNGNTSTIYEAVGAAGNLRFKGTGFQPPPLKKEEKPEEESNFKVKPKEENPTLKEGVGSVTNLFSDSSKSRFENLVSFPCNFQIKVVGARQGEFMEDILDVIGGVIKQTGRDLTHSFRDNGKWRSITVEVPVESAEQLYDVYAAIDRDPRVKFKF